MICVRCGVDTDVETPSRRDECPACGADLHACVQCSFYAPDLYNHCREPQADRVLDPARANFCDYFSPATTPSASGKPSAKEAAKAQLDALFGKKQ